MRVDYGECDLEVECRFETGCGLGAVDQVVGRASASRNVRTVQRIEFVEIGLREGLAEFNDAKVVRWSGICAARRYVIKT